MAYSNRPAHRPDPTARPADYDPRTGVNRARRPFTPSPYLEAKNREGTQARKRLRRARRLQARYGRA